MPLLVVFFLLLFVLGGGRQLWKVWRQGWDGQQRLSLFFLDKRQGWLLVVQPENKTVHVWRFPKDWLVTAAGNYGRFPVVGLGRLAAEEKAPRLLSDSLMLELGLPIDLALYSDSKDCLGEKGKNLQDCATSWLWYQGVLHQAKLAVGPRVNYFKLFLFLHRYHLDWQSTEASQLGLENGGEEYPNGKKLVAGNWLALGLKYFVSPEVRNEAIPVGVYNASRQSGLAAKIARVLKNSGGTIIHIGDRKPMVGCRWLLADKRLLGTLTFRHWQRLFPCRWKIKPANFFNDSSKMQLQVGQNWFLRGGE